MSRRSWVVRRGSLLLLTLLLAFAVRLVSLNRYVTPDEPAWVERSARFAHALSTRDWGAVPATGHPGVTTMWVGAAGIALRRWLQPAASAAHLAWIRNLAWLAPENGEAFRHLSFFLSCGRTGVALITTLALLPIYGMARRLFDPRVALVTLGLLAFDPFLVGHSGLLHTDALLATFSTLALLAGLNGLRGPRPAVWWALAGLCTGLALLTKTPALFLLPFLPLLLLVHSLVTRTRRPILVRLLPLRHAVVFLLVAGATVFALYPALWADPSQVMEMVGLYAGESSRATLLPVFFLGEMTLEPGPAFYPLAFLLRISPVVLIGLLAGGVRLRRFDPARRFTLLALLAFAGLFILALSLNVKKFDRYLLPAIPPLALVASAGLSPRRPTPLLPRHLLPVALQFLLLLPFAAYPLTYANPLLGGPPAAQHVLSTSWGEAPGAAARWLNRLPDAEELVVATHTIPSFASLFAGRTVGMDQAGLADYTIHAPSERASEPFLHYPAAYTATVGYIYSTIVLTQPLPLLQAGYLRAHAAPGDLIVVDGATPLLRRYEGPGTIRAAAGLPDEASLAAWLAEHMPAHGSTWVVSAPGGSAITAAHLSRQLRALATPVSTTTLSGSTIVRFTPRPSPETTSPSPFCAAFGGRVRLVDGVVEARSAWPEPARAVLRWQTPVEVETGHQVVLALVDAQGEVWSSLERPVLNAVDFHTPAWSAGEWAERAYELPLPAVIPPGEYSVEVSLYDAASGAGLGAAGPGGEFLGTRVPAGRVTILPPAGPPPRSALEMPVTREQPAGELTLLGMTPPAEEVLSGDSLHFELYWEATEPPASDYHVHLQLIDAAGTAALVQEVPLSPYPTSRWRAGDRYASHHRVHVPPRLPAGDYALRASGVGTLDALVGSVTVLPRERSFELPALPYSSTLSFGELVDLRGIGPQDLRAAPGGSLPLTLAWEAQTWSERSYTLFVHLVGPDGMVYGQVDRLPGGGTAPTTSWAPGQVIVEQLELPVDADAPPGTYRIALGFYDPLHGGSLPVAGQEDASGRALLPPEVIVTGGTP